MGNSTAWARCRMKRMGYAITGERARGVHRGFSSSLSSVAISSERGERRCSARSRGRCRCRFVKITARRASSRAMCARFMSWTGSPRADARFHLAEGDERNHFPSAETSSAGLSETKELRPKPSSGPAPRSISADSGPAKRTVRVAPGWFTTSASAMAMQQAASKTPNTTTLPGIICHWMKSEFVNACVRPLGDPEIVKAVVRVVCTSTDTLDTWPLAGSGVAASVANPTLPRSVRVCRLKQRDQWQAARRPHLRVAAPVPVAASFLAGPLNSSLARRFRVSCKFPRPGRSASSPCGRAAGQWQAHAGPVAAAAGPPVARLGGATPRRRSRLAGARGRALGSCQDDTVVVTSF